MPTTYRKTAKGQTEIETRQHRLPPRARAALILIDGKRGDDEIKAMISQQAEETVASLLEQGFIEVGGTDTAPRPRPFEPVAAPVPVAVVAPEAGFAARRQAAVRDLNDIVGPAAQTLAIKMERARDAAELQPLLQLAGNVIGNSRGRQLADSFLKRHLP